MSAVTALVTSRPHRRSLCARLPSLGLRPLRLLHRRRGLFVRQAAGGQEAICRCIQLWNYVMENTVTRIFFNDLYTEDSGLSLGLCGS